MSHTDPHQTMSISHHVPPLMTINVNSAHPFVHTKQNTTTHQAIIVGVTSNILY